MCKWMRSEDGKIDRKICVYIYIYLYRERERDLHNLVYINLDVNVDVDDIVDAEISTYLWIDLCKSVDVFVILCLQVNV